MTAPARRRHRARAAERLPPIQDVARHEHRQTGRTGPPGPHRLAPPAGDGHPPPAERIGAVERPGKFRLDPDAPPIEGATFLAGAARTSCGKSDRVQGPVISRPGPALARPQAGDRPAAARHRRPGGTDRTADRAARPAAGVHPEPVPAGRDLHGFGWAAATTDLFHGPGPQPDRSQTFVTCLTGDGSHGTVVQTRTAATHKHSPHGTSTPDRPQQPTTEEST